METSAVVILDSINPAGVRLTTLECVVPRYMLADLNTHRALSRNAPSSQAITTKRLLTSIEERVYQPNFWSTAGPRMTRGDELEEPMRTHAQKLWRQMITDNITIVECLADLGIANGIVNRFLEPFIYTKWLVSATDWNNFLKNRLASNDPEMRLLAQKIKQARDESIPDEARVGEWHLPYIKAEDYNKSLSPCSDCKEYSLAQVSAARCARLSYERKGVNIQKDFDMFHTVLMASDPPHWSPLEHPAQAIDGDYKIFSNFRGWKQLRKFYPGEDGE